MTPSSESRRTTHARRHAKSLAAPRCVASPQSRGRLGRRPAGGVRRNAVGHDVARLGTNMKSVPIRSYPTRGYSSPPVWLAVSTEHFEPLLRSSRNIWHNSARPIPRRRCDGLTYMSAHQVAPAASTLRTRPTICSPSSATYWRKGAPSPSRASGMGRERAALPSRAASSGVRTRSIDTDARGFGLRVSRWMKNPSVASRR